MSVEDVQGRHTVVADDRRQVRAVSEKPGRFGGGIGAGINDRQQRPVAKLEHRRQRRSRRRRYEDQEKILFLELTERGLDGLDDRRGSDDRRTERIFAQIAIVASHFQPPWYERCCEKTLRPKTGAFAGSAAATAATGVAATAIPVVRILAELVQHEQLLLRFGELPGGRAFGGDRLLDFASLHRVVVVQLAELLSDVVVHCRHAGLSLAAAVGDLRLQVTLAELILIGGLSDRIVQVGESAEHVVLDLPHQIGLPDLSLGGIVQASLDFRDVGRVGDGEIRTEGADAGTARTAVSAAVPATVAAAPSAAPETA